MSYFAAIYLDKWFSTFYECDPKILNLTFGDPKKKNIFANITFIY